MEEKNIYSLMSLQPFPVHSHYDALTSLSRNETITTVSCVDVSQCHELFPGMTSTPWFRCVHDSWVKIKIHEVQAFTVSVGPKAGQQFDFSRRNPTYKDQHVIQLVLHALHPALTRTSRIKTLSGGSIIICTQKQMWHSRQVITLLKSRNIVNYSLIIIISVIIITFTLLKGHVDLQYM